MSGKVTYTGAPAGYSTAPEGWPQAGDKMRFLGKNGYDAQLADAKRFFNEGQVLTVADCRVGAFDHTIKFVEEPKRWFNGVMFEAHPTTQPQAVS